MKVEEFKKFTSVFDRYFGNSPIGMITAPKKIAEWIINQFELKRNIFI